MIKSNLQIWAEEIAKKNNFQIDKLIYKGEYYSPDKIRNVIFTGTYKKHPAVLKVYDDPRITDEPVSLETFNKNNKSKILIAPRLYTYQIVSPQKGWLIMEKLPEGGNLFRSPLDFNERAKFLELFLEYRKNFPSEPTRPLTLAEHLSAQEFHIFRINRWFQLAYNKEEELVMKGGRRILDTKKFLPPYERGLAVIRKEFKHRKMIWCHGHFKPNEIYKSPNKNQYFLIDFAHTKMYPEGYELAFMIWSDYLIPADWTIDYKKWKQGVCSWLANLKPLGQKLKIKNFPPLLKAAMVERILGTVLADVCATNRPRKEKVGRVSLLSKLLQELV